VLRAGHAPATRLLGTAGLVGIVGCSFVIAAGAAGAASSLVPAGIRSFPGWLAGPLSVFDLELSPYGFEWLLIGMSVSYALVLWTVRTLSTRSVVVAIIAAHVVFLLGPPLFSADVIGYIAYARLGALHHIDPYAHGAIAAPLDPVLTYVRWGHLTSPYGPAFTILSYAVVPLGVPGSLWALKVAAAASSLGLVVLVARLAGALGRPVLPAVAFVGLNPLLLAYGVGGAHNDLLLTLVVITGVWLALARREAAAGATFVVAAAMKASSVLLLPFAAAGARHKRAVLTGMLGALAVVAVIALETFGVHAAGFVGQIRLQQNTVAHASVPHLVGRVLGLGGATDGIRAVALGAFAVAVAFALRAAYRGRDEPAGWIAPAGWATLALLATTAWLLPWYVVWMLPLAALGGDRRLELAALVFCAYVVSARVTFLLG
jgi:Glycosyltransferase family 87